MLKKQKNKKTKSKKQLFWCAFILFSAVLLLAFGHTNNNKPENTKEEIKSVLEEPKEKNFTNKSKEDITKTLSQRKDALLKEIAKDPSAIKKYALPKEVKDKLPEEAKALVEQDVEVKGKLKVLVADDFKNKKSEVSYKLEDTKKYDVKFIQDPQNLKSSEQVTAKGLALDSTLVLDSGVSPSLTINAPPRKALTGAQTALVIRFNWQNDTTQPFSASAINTQLYNGASSTNTFYQENSYGQLSFPGDTSNVTTSWYTIPYNKNSTCSDNDITDWTFAANSAATTAGYILGNYDNVIYLFPDNFSCSWAGLGEVSGALTWINGYNNSSLYSHELGHNIGEGHASSKDCGTKAIDSYGSCTDSEYGDDYDVMGGSWENYHYNAAFKNDAGWIAPGAIQTVVSSGTYTLNPLENAGSAKKAIKIQKPDTGEYYWLEYRQATGFDSTLPSGVTRGLIVHVFGGVSGDNSYLLDMTPTNGWGDVALSDGAAFTDSSNNISITQVSHNTGTVTFSILFKNLQPGTYDYWINSAVNPPAAMSAAGNAFVQVHLRNTGFSTWYNEAQYAADPITRRPMRLAVINADGRTFWPNNDTWVGNDRIAMTSSSVAPGQIGSFNFTMKAPTTPGYHTLRFMPVVEGVQALRDIGMQFGTTISYDYWINSAVNPPVTMTAGSTAFVQVHLRNTGLSTWYNEGLYNASPSTRRPMRLAVINADGQNFFPNNDTWVDSVRIAMTSSRVAPGEIGSFNFTVKAPATPGYHTLRFVPVVEGVQALRDIGMQFGITAQ